MNDNDFTAGQRAEPELAAALRLNRLLTVGEVASILRAHPESVRRWHDGGLLDGYRIGRRGARRFREEAVRNFLSAWPNLETESPINTRSNELRNH